MRRVLSAKQKVEIWGKSHERELPHVEAELVVRIPRVREDDCAGCGEEEAPVVEELVAEEPVVEKPKAQLKSKKTEETGGDEQ